MSSEQCVHCGHGEAEHSPGFLCKAQPTEGQRYAEEWGCTCPGFQGGKLTRRK